MAKENVDWMWVIPSTGDENTDIFLGHEFGVAFLSWHFLGECDDADFESTHARIDLKIIQDALSVAENADGYAYGFCGAIEGFIDCCMNAPQRFKEIRQGLLELSPDAMRKRCGLVLEGMRPPCILA